MVISISKKIILVYIISAILAIIAVFSTFFSTTGKNIQFIQTTLLNPRYVPLVDTIEIKTGSPDQLLKIRKNSLGYQGQSDTIYFPITLGKVEELLRLSSESVQVRIISDNIRDWEHYGVEGNGSANTYELIFLESNSSIAQEYSHLFFGFSDFTSANRYVRSSANATIYAIPDDYYSFLLSSPNAWVDPKFIPDYILGLNNVRDIESILIKSANRDFKILRGDPGFEKARDTIFSLQSSNVVKVAHKDFESNSEGIKHAVEVSFSNGFVASFLIIKKSEYIIIPQHKDLLYGLEISSWTLERLMTALIENYSLE